MRKFISLRIFVQELLEEIGEKMAFFWENAFNYFDRKAEICTVFPSGTAAKEERISLYGYDRNYRIVANATNEKEHSERRVDGRTSKMQHNVLAERSKRKTCHLEMLTGKRNADDGDEQENAEKDVHQPGPQTTENIQRMFNGMRMQPVGDSVSFTSAPKGHRQSRPILKVCKATGMPIIVMAIARLPVK